MDLGPRSYIGLGRAWKDMWLWLPGRPEAGAAANSNFIPSPLSVPIPTKSFVRKHNLKPLSELPVAAVSEIDSFQKLARAVDSHSNFIS